MKTLVLVKPDAIRRKLAGDIICEIEEVYSLHGLWLGQNRDRLIEHYIEHQNREMFGGLIESMSAGPLIAMIVEHRIVPDDTIQRMRDFVGPYKNRVKGTLRYRYALNDRENSVHASDSVENANREISLWFPTI